MEKTIVVIIVLMAILSVVKTVSHLIQKEWIMAIAYAVLSFLAIIAFMIRL